MPPLTSRSASGATCVPTGCRPGGRPPNLRWRGKLYSVTSSRALLPTPLASSPFRCFAGSSAAEGRRGPWPGRSPSRAELLEELCPLTGDFEPHQLRPNPIDGANLVRRSVGIIRRRGVSTSRCLCDSAPRGAGPLSLLLSVVWSVPGYPQVLEGRAGTALATRCILKMLVFCAWCQRDGKPGYLGEREPPRLERSASNSPATHPI